MKKIELIIRRAYGTALLAKQVGRIGFKKLSLNIKDLFETVLKHLKSAWIVYLFIVLAGLFNASMDKMQFHYHKSIFAKWDNSKPGHISFWNPQESWKRKYKNWPEDQRPAFPGAITWAVGLTDGWHLAQGAWIVCVFLLPFLQQQYVPERTVYRTVVYDENNRPYLKIPLTRVNWWLFPVYFALYTSSFTFFFHYLLEV